MGCCAFIAFSPSGKGVVVGHADGSIIKYMFEDDGAGDTNVRIQFLF